MYFIGILFGCMEFFFLNICISMFCRPQIKIFIEGLFSFDQDIAAFKEHLRDFLVQIRVRIHLNWNLKCNVDDIFLKIWYTWQITAIALEGMDHYLKQINWYSDTYGLLKVLNVYLHVGYELIQCNLYLHNSFAWVSLTGVCRGRQPGPLPWGERTGHQTGPGRETQNTDVCARNSRTSRNSRGHAGLGPLTNWNWLTKSV